ncbi:lysine N(6)-hydroxylase/L-ornithine N(5)-oxygenase family protein [Cellulomonas sp. Leaf334]|uniref:lysine N(6)-hydroxylase/L-ornithine N(5)-oxygenase family protein n=1 Tax=Cellulomonas sp. Leaf334 TaxID=1736339 RepID=UPI0006FEBAA5|nr:SidA/IucD/PvdA family monooxygenase [Cellulomonas sp. Leaf334]KQR16492.1 hypothetical protein ASF78_03695 [Cellulomonas sp. Leaf334]
MVTDDVDLDVLGVGFGPANIALAIALDEYARGDGPALRTLFVEQSPRLSWHEGMLFDDASMQVSFLKDLATFRNPASPYTFVSFLKAVDRLVDFTNRGSMTPLRVEFVAYLRWVADQLSHLVRYGTRVVRVTPVVADGVVVRHDVLVERDGHREVLRARHVVMAAGLQPRLPDGVVAGPRTWHSAAFLPRVEALGGGSEFVVVGSGQSAAEVAMHLYRRFPEATVHLVSTRFGLAPADQGPLVNQVFDPATVDLVFDADPAARDHLARLHANTNYGVVNADLVREVFDVIYRDRWLGVERLVLHRTSRVTGVVESADEVVVRVVDGLTGDVSTVHADAVVLATGYRAFDGASLLGPDADLLVRDDAGRVLVDRDCRARLRVDGPAGLYLVGQSEHQHGVATTLLSTVAVRAGEIADSLLTAHLVDQPEPTHV